MTDYLSAKNQKAQLEKELDAAEKTLKAIPGVGSGAMGLTPESVKSGADYQAARRVFDQKMKQVQVFNREFIKSFGKLWREELHAKRGQKRE